jgi:hypothetical protein
MGGPETATFDAVLGRSLAVGGLAVMCTKGHGRQGLLPPVLRVGRAWCLCPLIGGCLIYTVAAAGPHPYSPSITLPGGGEPFLAPLLLFCFPEFP